MRKCVLIEIPSEKSDVQPLLDYARHFLDGDQDVEPKGRLEDRGNGRFDLVPTVEVIDMDRMEHNTSSEYRDDARLVIKESRWTFWRLLLALALMCMAIAAILWTVWGGF